MSADWRIEVGDCRDVLRSMPAESVHTVVTSPPYFGLRDYGTGEWEGGDPACDHLGAPHRTQAGFNERYFGREKTEGWEDKQGALREPFRDVCGKCGARRVDRQIGLEPTPDEFVAALVAVFREVRRVLRDDGTVWLNLGDSYAANGRYDDKYEATRARDAASANNYAKHGGSGRKGYRDAEVKAKDLLGIPWMVAFALRADGWYLRSDIVWSKPNPMPESITDRPTKAHEMVFLLAKSARYFYDADAVREPHKTANRNGDRRSYKPGSASSMNDGEHQAMTGSFAGLPLNEAGRNMRSVWDVPEDLWSQFLRWLDSQPLGSKADVWRVSTQPYAGAHFATFPPKLIEPCVLAGAPEGGTVLDPFAGVGTTGVVALQHGREFVGIELNPAYAAMARDRIETAVRLGFRAPQRERPAAEGQDALFEAES